MEASGSYNKGDDMQEILSFSVRRTWTLLILAVTDTLPADSEQNSAGSPLPKI